MALVGDRLEDQAAGLVGHDLAPVRALRRRHRRLADAEVLRTVGIGGDDQALAMMLHGILVAMLARHDQARAAFGPIGVDQVDFARLVVVRVDDDELARLRLADADVKAAILLLVDECVVGGRRAHAVAVDVKRALVGIEAHVEQRLAVASPDDGAAGVRDGIGQIPAGCQVADADREQLRSLLVDGVGQELVVGAVRHGADLPVTAALGLLVAVEQDLRLRRRRVAVGTAADTGRR